jgi:hypothetical protein
LLGPSKNPIKWIRKDANISCPILFHYNLHQPKDRSLVDIISKKGYGLMKIASKTSLFEVFLCIEEKKLQKDKKNRFELHTQTACLENP